MSNLPKSLHTVRILVAVVRNRIGFLGTSLSADRALREIHRAAAFIGYPFAYDTDPLIVKAAAQLRAGK